VLPGGFLGVDVFFVISGYVISASLMRQPPARLFDLHPPSSPISLQDFMRGA
jgi:peptidoglycan/LPS O-acetylase OafA/YrhL